MNRFPDEILLNIFQNVSLGRRFRLEDVCERWRRLMPYEDLRSVDLVECLHGDAGEDVTRSMGTFPADDGLLALAKRGSDTLTSVSFGQSYLLVTPRTIQIIGYHCKALKHIDLSYCKVTESIIPALNLFAGRLESLNLANTMFWLRDPTRHSENVEILFAQCGRLQRLNLQRTSQRNLPAIIYLPGTLQSVNLNNCGPLRQQILIQFLLQQPQLEELRLSAYDNMDELVIDTICSLSLLRILELSHTSFLDIIHHRFIAAEAMENLERLHQLEELYVQFHGRMTSRALRHICVACRNLHTLNLANCRNVDDYRSLITLHELRVIIIGATDAFVDLDLISIAAAGQKLEIFRATGCRIGNPGITALADHCSGSLREVSVNQGDRVNDTSVLKLLRLAAKLTKLSIQGADVTNDVILALKEAPSRLVELDVSFCRQITDDAIEDFLGFLKTERDRGIRRQPFSIQCHQTKVSRSMVAKTSGLPVKLLL